MKDSLREAKRWFFQANDDFQFVQWITQEGMYFDKGCFIAQQSAEKALKACHYALGKRRVFGHSLFELCSEISMHEDLFKQILEEAKRLDRFYIPTRYPNGLPGGAPFQTYSDTDLEDALTDLKKVIAACKNFLKERGIIESTISK